MKQAILILFALLLLLCGCDKEDAYNDVKSSDELTGTRWMQKLDNHPLRSVYLSFAVNNSCGLQLYDGDFKIALHYTYNKPNITITYLSSTKVYALGYLKDDVMYLNMKDDNIDLELKSWSMPQ